MSLALVVALALAGAPGPSADEEKEKLKSVRAELDERRSAINDLDNEQRSITDSIGQLDESLAQLNDDAEAADKKLEALRAELVTLEERAGIDEKSLGEARARLQDRMRALYVGGEGGTARALLGAEGFEELALRRRFLQVLTQNDARLVDDVARTEKAVRDHRERLREATEEAAFTAKEIADQRALIEETRTLREETIGRITSERSLAKRHVKELEDTEQHMAMLVEKLVEQAHRRHIKRAARRGILASGKLPRPVEGRVIRRFGIVVDKDSGAEVVCNGLEIRAAAGTPVSTVADGRVAYVGWMRGFGRVVIIDHGEGHHTISAHLSKVAVSGGDTVKRGQTIGFVGDTESFNGPKLYFELRENGRPRDPAPFLR